MGMLYVIATRKVLKRMLLTPPQGPELPGLNLSCTCTETRGRGRRLACRASGRLSVFPSPPPASLPSYHPLAHWSLLIKLWTCAVCRPLHLPHHQNATFATALQTCRRPCLHRGRQASQRRKPGTLQIVVQRTGFVSDVRYQPLLRELQPKEIRKPSYLSLCVIPGRSSKRRSSKRPRPRVHHSWRCHLTSWGPRRPQLPQLP